jgi:hypothetical protein
VRATEQFLVRSHLPTQGGGVRATEGKPTVPKHLTKPLELMRQTRSPSAVVFKHFVTSDRSYISDVWVRVRN